ncbi:hypothetical protein [Kitasatospora sp. NPDC017646]|uniref:hypothetical protein n=1 Tax=Kitasatospora sp. NPDC017646 TaxID=3364024 RepID=UPI003798CE2E
MANQKLELQSQARRAVLQLDQTERPRLVLLAISGPSQYLVGALFGGLLSLFLIKSYFISVTDRAVFIHRGPRLNPHPKELVHVVPLEDAGGLVSRVKLGRAWNALFLKLPGRARPTRLNVSFHSRSELDSFLGKLGAAEHS